MQRLFFNSISRLLSCAIKVQVSISLVILGCESLDLNHTKKRVKIINDVIKLPE